jgi:hypothetical protein
VNAKTPEIKILYTANCDICNPVDQYEPVVYDDPEKRIYECQRHCDKTGHTMQIGFMIV